MMTRSIERIVRSKGGGSMTLRSRVRSWMRAMVGRTAMESEMDAELRFHMQAYAEDLERQGVAHDEAMRRARIEFGGVESAKEECREARGVNLLDSLIRDVRYGLRSLRKDPSFTLAAVLTLGLGIGASTTIFSVVENVLVEPFPYPDANRMMTVEIHDVAQNQSSGRAEYSGPEFLDYIDKNHVFDHVIADASLEVLHDAGEGTERFHGVLTTPGTFEFFGLPALLGRMMEPEDYEPGAPPVFVLRYKTWVTNFAGDPAVLNKTFVKWNALFQLCSEDHFALLRIKLVQGRVFGASELNDGCKLAVVNEMFVRKYFGSADPVGQHVQLSDLQNYPDRVADPSFEIVAVVGDVLNQGMQQPVEPEVWIPASVTGSGLRGILVRASDDPLGLMNEVRREVWATDRSVALTFSGSLESFINMRWFAGPRFGFVVMSVFAGAGLVLVTIGVYSVIAYATARRKHEIGIRMALGAQVRDIVRLVLTHGARLALIGVAIGVPAALLLAWLMQSQLFGTSANDPSTLIAVTLLLLLVGMLACYVPARRATRVDPLVALRYE
jgi:FtsX-like permease family/MacB-like periplasmic core domain